VTAMSEVLTPRDRAVIADAFGVPVINQFASTEGLVGQSEPGGSVLGFASDLCLAELVDDDNQPVPDGTASAKVLVTNLHNLTQPLVRYELTDRFIRPPGTTGHGYLRAGVEGRADEPFRYGRVEVHPHVLRSTLVAAAAVREYQVRQTERGVDVACVPDGAVAGRALASRLEQGLRRAGLAEPQVCVRMVAAISRDPLTGKVRRFIPNCPAEMARPRAG
jgi:phenylacetate-CoA ligase